MFNSGWYQKWLKTFSLLGLITLTVFQFSVAVAAEVPQFEAPHTEKASDILPPELLSGPHYKVRDNVISYGYMNNYQVESDFGAFEAKGNFGLRKLIREIGAIASLQEIKKGQAYLDGLKNAASQPVEFGKNLITEPVDTISGIPKGVARLFGNVTTGLTSESGPGEDSKAKQALAVSSNKRELAAKLGVDVYSSNSVLQKELNSVAWATALGSLTVSAALAPVGGPAAAAVSATRLSQQLNDLLKENPPQRMRQINEEKLLAMGIPPDLATRFLDHNAYTTTQETVVVQSLEALSGAKGRDAFIQLALSADDEESANYLMNIAETLRGYQLKAAPILNISVYGPLVMAKADNGVVLIPLPLDRGIWTERANERVPMAINAYKSANPDAKNYEAWVTGTLSEMAKEKMAGLGVKVVEKVDKIIEYIF